MQYINSTFHERIKDGITPQYIRLHFTDINGLPCVFENEDIVGEVQIDQYFCTGEELKFGDTPSNTISFTLLNENQRLAGFPFGNCSAYIGVETRSEGGSFPSGAKAYVYTQRGSHLIVDDQGFKVGTGAVDYVVRGTFVSLCVFESMVYLLTPTRVLVFQETAQNTVISVGQTALRPNVYLQKFMSQPMGVYWHGQYLETWDALDTHSHKTFSFAGLGTYYCERPVNTKTGTIDFSDQHDRMVEMDADAAEALAEFETNDTLNDIAITMWGNSDVIASINPYATVEQEYNPFYTDEVRTKRDVLSKIAERLRSVAMVRNGKLTFRALGTSPVERIGETDIAMGSFVAHDVPIELTTGVLLKSGNASLAYGDLTNPYYIYANPLITEITASDLEAYKALPNYYPCSFEIINADPAVEVGDLINIEGLINAFIMIANSDNEAVVSTDTVAYATWQPLNAVPLLQRTIHFNGHCSAEYRIPGRQKHEIPDNVAANAALSLEEVKQLDNSLTQQEIFDRLTDGGQAQGIYLQDGKIYVNAEYIQAGVLTGVEINNGNGTFRVSESGVVYASDLRITGGSIDIEVTQPYMNLFRITSSYNESTHRIAIGAEQMQAVWESEQGFSYTSNYSSTGLVTIMDGHIRTQLSKEGLTFLDANGNRTANYPATPTNGNSLAVCTCGYNGSGWNFKINVGGQYGGRMTFIILAGHQSGAGYTRMMVCTATITGAGGEVSSVAISYYQPYQNTGSLTASYNATSHILSITMANAWAGATAIYDSRFLDIQAV